MDSMPDYTNMLLRAINNYDENLQNNIDFCLEDKIEKDIEITMIQNEKTVNKQYEIEYIEKDENISYEPF